MRCFDRFEHQIRVSGLGQRIGDLVREIALMRIVATEFLERRDDLCGLSLSEDGEPRVSCSLRVASWSSCRCAINTIALIKSATVDTIPESKGNGNGSGALPPVASSAMFKASHTATPMPSAPNSRGRAIQSIAELTKRWTHGASR